ncbi:hypothetical protein KLA_16617 [Cellulophaga geojensis KL-A]|uniref:Uncharacterized protein n=1 Tax=Cellulophaga geojensis KL-A TaxID=1328323 RepID=A0ABN0RJN4_9FLAO|nr:type VI secretion system baseplate subunit TssF [Cellulophaga geojensis]EWH10545.1 hypothetical protein KLA_16617 [Cellulophaga geojensis KL-A]
MRDQTFLTLKKRMLKRSMELWGINEANDIDPLIDLLIDVYAYEKAKLYQEIKLSDTQLLHRLSRILMSSKWSSPMPAHGLMLIYPNDDSYTVSSENHFYVNTSSYGKDNLSVFFTPLVKSNIYKAQVKHKLINTDIVSYTNNEIITNTFFDANNRVEDNALWLGIEITDEQLNSLDKLSVTILMEDLTLYPLLNAMSVNGENRVNVNCTKQDFEPDALDETHYFNEINNYYKDYFYLLELSKNAHTKKSLSQLFPFAKKEVGDLDYDQNLFWVKIKLPEIFSYKKLKEFHVYLNAVPVVNRKRIYKQHNYKKNGRIVSLPSESKNYFLNVKSAQDDNGNYLKNILKDYENKKNGSYSLYFGDIEKFDTRSAKVLIGKVIQAIREEGNAFTAMNPEKLEAYLEELVSQLALLEQKAVENIKDVDILQNPFLLTYPYANGTNYEIEYWITNAEVGNGFDEHSRFNQYATNEFNIKKTRLLTQTIGGKIRKEEREQIDSLRYGLLTKERIVSTADIKSYINQQIGNYVSTIEIKPGVKISKEKKKGIIRTTDVIITLSTLFSSALDLNRLGVYFENELTQKSISSIPYNVVIQ